MPRRTRAAWAAAAALCALPAATAVFAAQCTLKKFAEFPITMVGLRPLMTAKINDAEVRFMIDSGAFYSQMSRAAAAQLKLKTFPAPFSLQVSGAHGAVEEISVAKVQTFELAGAALHNVEFLVGGSDTGQGSVGLLGQNFLHIADAEYDLGGGTVRLMSSENCNKSSMAYWAGTTVPYSVLALEEEPALNGGNTGRLIHPPAGRLSHTIGSAYVDGNRISVMFDSGAGDSILSLKAAARVGIRPDSPGVVSGGMSYGLGMGTFATYLVPVSSFRIGQEEIKNTRIRIGDIEVSNVDMLIGADFFLSHRMFVANSQRKLYFTYNGGPVFNLSTGNPKPGVADSAPAASADADADSGSSSGATAGTEAAADFARRGAAFAARQEFDQALVVLNRACELAPQDAGYAYLRGTVYRALKQPDAARADFDRALKLKPDDVQTLMARAGLEIGRKEKAAAQADLDAAAAAAPREADVRLQLASDYERQDSLAPAIEQLSLWIDVHADDARLPTALNSRCWDRALTNTELPLALKDCSAALRHADKGTALYSMIANSRGLVYLRMSDYRSSIADYDASLKIEPKNASSLYGRGLARLRNQETSAGTADIQSALAIRPHIEDDLKRWGIFPP